MVRADAVGKRDRNRTVQHRADRAMGMPMARLAARQNVVMRWGSGGMNGGMMVMLDRRRRGGGARPALDHVHEMDRQIELDDKRQHAEPGAEACRLQSPKHHVRTMIAGRRMDSARQT